MFNMSKVYLPTLPPILRVLFAKVPVPMFMKGNQLAHHFPAPLPSVSIFSMSNSSYLTSKHNDSTTSLLVSPCVWLFSTLNLVLKATSSERSPLTSLSWSYCNSGFPPLMFTPVCSFTYLFACHRLHLHHPI